MEHEQRVEVLAKIHSYRYAVVRDGVVENIILGSCNYKVEDCETVCLAHVVDKTAMGEDSYEEFPLIEQKVDLQWLWDGKNFCEPIIPEKELKRRISKLVKKILMKGVDIDGVKIPITDELISHLPVLLMTSESMDPDDTIEIKAHKSVVGRKAGTFKADVAAIMSFRNGWLKKQRSIFEKIESGEIQTTSKYELEVSKLE